LQQQSKFDAFQDEYNRERPHQALAMKCPAEVYARARGAGQGLAGKFYGL
jgi:hypothetical protein